MAATSTPLAVALALAVAVAGPRCAAGETRGRRAVFVTLNQTTSRAVPNVPRLLKEKGAAVAEACPWGRTWVQPHSS